MNNTLFMTYSGKLFHILKSTNTLDSCYSYDNPKLIGFCGVSGATRDSLIFDKLYKIEIDNNSVQKICPRCYKIFCGKNNA